MNRSKEKRLEAGGWRVEAAAAFLEPTPAWYLLKGLFSLLALLAGLNQLDKVGWTCSACGAGYFMEA